MPESLNPTKDGSPRWRLIPSQGSPGSSTIEGTQQQADVLGRELSDLYGCKVLVTQLKPNGVPINHHWVGRNRPKVNQPNPKEPNMGATTSMAREPRTTNGSKTEVKTNPTKSSVLTQEQMDELAAKRAASKANGGKKASGRKSTPKSAPKAKQPTEHKINKADLGRALTAIRKTLKSLPEEQHAVATSIRKELTGSWKAIDGGSGIDEYISTITTARQLAGSIKLTATVSAADAALKLAEQAKKQS